MKAQVKTVSFIDAHNFLKKGAKRAIVIWSALFILCVCVYLYN